jgi:PhnB protein
MTRILEPREAIIVATKPKPDGYHSVTPYLAVEGAAKLLDFLKQAFNATDAHLCMKRPDGSIHHAEVTIGDSIVMVGDAQGQWKPMPSTLYLYVDDTDATYHRALAAGATSLMEPATQFYGDRNAGVQDPSGNYWWIATHVEDVSPEEVKRRAETQSQQSH